MNFDIIDLGTSNLVHSYLTADEASAALADFGDPDFAIFEVLPTGRRRQVPVTIGTLMAALEQSIEQARIVRGANAAASVWTISQSRSGELALAESA